MYLDAFVEFPIFVLISTEIENESVLWFIILIFTIYLIDHNDWQYYMADSDNFIDSKKLYFYSTVKLQPKTNGACKYRSGSGEVGSASADSIASEDLLSSPAIDLVLDYSQTIEKNDVTLMTDQIPACSVGTQTGEILFLCSIIFELRSTFDLR